MKKTKNKICVVGDILLDKHVEGACSRISPEAPVQIIDHINSIYLLGGAANVAKNISILIEDRDAKQNLEYYIIDDYGMSGFISSNDRRNILETLFLLLFIIFCN